MVGHHLSGKLVNQKGSDRMGEQKYKSAITSVNNHKVTALARVIASKYADTNWDVLDYGGGRFDTTTEFLKTVHIRNHVYDPYNRSSEENLEALSRKNYVLVMLSNVLNVIAEQEVRLKILQDIRDHMCSVGSLYIKIYEGNKSGIMTISEKRNSCQLNKKTEEYLDEVFQIFEHVRLERICGVPVIIAEKERWC